MVDVLDPAPAAIGQIGRRATDWAELAVSVWEHPLVQSLTLSPSPSPLLDDWVIEWLGEQTKNGSENREPQVR